MCVMLRAMLENVFAAERLDKLFERTAQLQENKTLLFSVVADIIGLVALKIQPSVHAAFRRRPRKSALRRKRCTTSCSERNPVSRMMVRDSGSRLRDVLGKLRVRPAGVGPGYRVKIVDGNHLRRPTAS